MISAVSVRHGSPSLFERSLWGSRPIQFEQPPRRVVRAALRTNKYRGASAKSLLLNLNVSYFGKQSRYCYFLL